MPVDAGGVHADPLGVRGAVVASGIQVLVTSGLFARSKGPQTQKL